MTEITLPRAKRPETVENGLRPGAVDNFISITVLTADSWSMTAVGHGPSEAGRAAHLAGSTGGRSFAAKVSRSDFRSRRLAGLPRPLPRLKPPWVG